MAQSTIRRLANPRFGTWDSVHAEVFRDNIQRTVKITRTHPALLMALALPSILRAGFCSSNPGTEPRHDLQFLAGFSPASVALIHEALDTAASRSPGSAADLS
jgi:hypothetical protein